MGNITISSNMNPLINNALNSSTFPLERQSALKQHAISYETSVLQSKYIPFSTFPTVRPVNQFVGQFRFNMSNISYLGKSTMLFDYVPLNNYLSYNSGTFKALKPFTGTFNCNIVIQKYLLGDSMNPMTISIKKGNVYTFSGNITSPTGLNIQISGKYPTDPANMPTTSATNCAGVCNSNPACAAYVQNSTQCMYYSSIDPTRLTTDSNSNIYYLSNSNRFNTNINVSYKAGDTFTFEVSRACTMTPSLIIFYPATYTK